MMMMMTMKKKLRNESESSEKKLWISLHSLLLYCFAIFPVFYFSDDFALFNPPSDSQHLFALFQCHVYVYEYLYVSLCTHQTIWILCGLARGVCKCSVCSFWSVEIEFSISDSLLLVMVLQTANFCQIRVSYWSGVAVKITTVLNSHRKIYQRQYS